MKAVLSWQTGRGPAHVVYDGLTFSGNDRAENAVIDSLNEFAADVRYTVSDGPFPGHRIETEVQRCVNAVYADAAVSVTTEDRTEQGVIH